MSKKKDRDRLLRRKTLQPDYEGYRGRSVPRPSRPSVKGVTCTVCGRVRNMPQETEEDGFVCSACREKEG